MALNLVRNSKVFFTTNVDSSGKVNTSGFTASNTYELQVLEGFSFSQKTNNEVVTITEGGAIPVRGQRAFNTSLAPVDFSFSTYLRPSTVGGKVYAEEVVLWNALLSSGSIGDGSAKSLTFTGATYTAATKVFTAKISSGAPNAGVPLAVNSVVNVSGINAGLDGMCFIKAYSAATSGADGSIELVVLREDTPASVTVSQAGTLSITSSAWTSSSESGIISSELSNVHQLQKFGLIFKVDSAVYIIDYAALGQVTVDFGLDAIATAAWTGNGTRLRQLDSSLTLTTNTDSTTKVTTYNMSEALTGSYTPKNTDAAFISNKLSTVSLKVLKNLVKADGTSAADANTVYPVALTGGSFTINNNITYLTPANLGVINQPVTYYTGARAVTGTLNAYLKTGTGGGTGALLADMLEAASTAIEPMFELTISIGGSGSSRVEVSLPSAVMQVPSVDVQQVVSTALEFTAQGSTGTEYDLSKTNDVSITYYHA